ncbi:hypothetical protein TRICI_005812 [Trichomonascus ciferrii]|uniref:Uncharacterized protein n=1 Tax=Trichomonascus ciferrii TaxID=44093 RepID=A0A642UPK8_9ASCO|nr:hypothetical protein TRICI_005812 [Trichomonascus ciferrii]
MNGQQHLITPGHSARNSYDFSRPSKSAGLVEGERLSRTVSRESASRTNPILAPFTRATSYDSATAAASSVSLDSTPVRGKGSIKRHRHQHTEDLRGSKVFFPSLTNSSASPAPKSQSMNNLAASKDMPALQVSDEFGSVISPMDSKQTNTSSQSSSQPNISNDAVNELLPTTRWSSADSGRSSHFSVINAIRDLKNALEYDIVVRLDSTEIDLESQVQSFEKSLNQIKQLRTQCFDLIEAYRTNSSASLENMDNQIKRLSEIQQDFLVVDQLEERLNKARNNVEDCKKRLVLVNQRVGLQENDNKQRNQRIKHLKRGSLLCLILTFVLAFLIKHYIFNPAPKPMSLDNIIVCLHDLDSC